jgi:hypothetical protein
MRRLLVTANVVPNSQIHVTQMVEALRSSETLVLTRDTWHNIPQDDILHQLLITSANMLKCIILQPLIT